MIFDLANSPGGGIVAAIGDTGESSYFDTARFDANGALDPSYGVGGFTEEVNPHHPRDDIEAQGQAVAVQPDGKVVAAGYVIRDEIRADAVAPLLVRYRRDGSLDPSFGKGGTVTSAIAGENHNGLRGIEGGSVLHDVTVGAGGRIIAVGGLNQYGGQHPAGGLAIAYRADGRIDQSFGRRGRVLFPHKGIWYRFTTLYAVKILGDGNILVAGYRNNRLFLARLDHRGRRDRSFGGGDGIVDINIGRDGACCPEDASLVVQRDGRILVQVNGGHVLGQRLFLFRFLPDGQRDQSFGHHGLSAPRRKRGLGRGYGLAIQPDGKIVVAGALSRNSTTTDEYGFAATRFLSNGRLDLDFGREAVQFLQAGRGSAPRAAIVQPDGRVVAAGGLEEGGGRGFEPKLLMTRYLAGG